MTTLTLDHPLRFEFSPIIDGVRAPLANPARGLMRSTAPMGLVDAPPINTTLGWDTVFAAPVSRVNQHFAVSGLYPKDYDGKFSGSLFSAEAKGDFGNWAISIGGSGAIIYLSIPIASGTMKAGTSSFPLAGGNVSLQVKLNFLPQPPQGPQGTPNNLKVSSKPINQTGNIAQVNGVTIPNITDPTVLSAAQGCFQDFFNKNIGRVAYVFNTVNLNAIAATAAFQWLKPTTTDYAYYQPGQNPTTDNSVFGVLCMVNNNPPGNNTNEIGPTAIPHKDGLTSDSGFSINSQIFLKQMVLPVMAAAFNAGNPHHIDNSYFQISNNDTEIVQTRNIPMKTVLYGAVNYYPECTSFKVTLQATQLIVYNLIHVNISPGIDAYLEKTTYYTLGLKTDNKGVQYLDFVKTDDPPPNTWTHVATGIIITSVIVAIIGACFAGLAYAVGEGVEAIIIAIVIAVVFGIAAAVPGLIVAVAAKGVIGNLPSIQAMVTDATNDIQWTGGQAFKPVFAQLNGTFQLGGIAFPSTA